MEGADNWPGVGVGTYETAPRYLSKEREEAGAIIERVDAVQLSVCVKVVVGQLPFPSDILRAGVRDPVHVATFGAQHCREGEPQLARHQVGILWTQTFQDRIVLVKR